MNLGFVPRQCDSKAHTSNHYVLLAFIQTIITDVLNKKIHYQEYIEE